MTFSCTPSTSARERLLRFSVDLRFDLLVATFCDNLVYRFSAVFNLGFGSKAAGVTVRKTGAQP